MFGDNLELYGKKTITKKNKGLFFSDFSQFKIIIKYNLSEQLFLILMLFD